MREASAHHLTLLAGSDAEAELHAGLLGRRPHLRSVSLLRWLEWGCSVDDGWRLVARLRPLPRAQRRVCSADARLESLPAGLHSLLVGEFALGRGTLDRLGRYVRSTGATDQQVLLRTGCLRKLFAVDLLACEAAHLVAHH